MDLLCSLLQCEKEEIGVSMIVSFIDSRTVPVVVTLITFAKTTTYDESEGVETK